MKINKENNFNKNYIFYFIFINFIYLILNLFFVFKNNIKKNFFKNIDLFSLNLSMKSYNNISIYLNSKYTTNERNKNLKKNNLLVELKKNVRIYFVGSYSNHFKKILINNVIEGLKDKFTFEITQDNPDYLVYDVFDCNYLQSKYNKSIKIAFYTENQIPDFNKADYAIGFHNLNYLDRYFKKTTLIWIFERRYLNIKSKDFLIRRNKAYKSKIRKKFCAALISNFLSSDKFRIKFIKELNKYKKVDMGGHYMNNVGRRVKNKMKFLSLYKFSISMENSEGQGYISEKIFDSFLAGTIPIYYGGYMIDEFINPKAFILIRNEKDMKEKIEYIKKLDKNEKLYKSFLKQKLFLKDNLVQISKKEKIQFFNNIFEQDINKAKRIDNYHLNIN